MNHTSSPPARSQIEEIIDGINDADIASAVKQGLLQQIKKEGGIYSETLRKKILDVFEEQVALERKSRRDHDALMRTLGSSKNIETAGHELIESGEIVAGVSNSQEQIIKHMSSIVSDMRRDVVGIERKASQAQESQRSSIDGRTIDRIRSELLDNPTAI